MQIIYNKDLESMMGAYFIEKYFNEKFIDDASLGNYDIVEAATVVNKSEFYQNKLINYIKKDCKGMNHFVGYKKIQVGMTPKITKIKGYTENYVFINCFPCIELLQHLATCKSNVLIFDNREYNSKRLQEYIDSELCDERSICDNKNSILTICYIFGFYKGDDLMTHLNLESFHNPHQFEFINQYNLPVILIDDYSCKKQFNPDSEPFYLYINTLEINEYDPKKFKECLTDSFFIQKAIVEGYTIKKYRNGCTTNTLIKNGYFTTYKSNLFWVVNYKVDIPIHYFIKNLKEILKKEMDKIDYKMLKAIIYFYFDGERFNFILFKVHSQFKLEDVLEIRSLNKIRVLTENKDYIIFSSINFPQWIYRKDFQNWKQ